MEKIQPLPPQSPSLMEEAVSSTPLQQCDGNNERGKDVAGLQRSGEEKPDCGGGCVCVCVCEEVREGFSEEVS